LPIKEARSFHHCPLVSSSRVQRAKLQQWALNAAIYMSVKY